MALATIAAAFLFWRYVWFFRDPPRAPPAAPGLLSPADGTVVYVRRVAPGEPVVVIKQGLAATVRDIMRDDFDRPKLVVGIFMSPFDVHYNRAPLEGTIGFVRRHAALGENAHMGEMHWRSLFDLPPRYQGSMHIVQNERAVTLIEGTYRGAALPCYVVQIGARTVNGIDSYLSPGQHVRRGQTFGMIRVGSQVDMIVPWSDAFEVLVRPGERVIAGETVVVR
ncbi:MAG: phosphatidylserine decarboxylase [Usitatibacter sp.]